jgi:hypothetical protein
MLGPSQTLGEQMPTQGTLDIPLQVNRAEVLRYLGHRVADPCAPDARRQAPPSVPRQVSDLVDSAIAWACGAVRTAGVFRSAPVTSVGEAGVVRLSGEGWDLTARSADLARLLASSVGATVFAVTLGHALDDRVRELAAQGRVAAATVLDAVGSDAAEGAADWLCRQLLPPSREMGLRQTARFSPGYGDLDLSFQAPLLGVLDAGRIGITVNAAYMLSPQKTVTAVLGWEPQDGSGCGQPRPCGGCGMAHCVFRREV